MAQFPPGRKVRSSAIGIVGTEVVRTSNSGNITGTETTVDTLTVPVVAGRRYKIQWQGGIFSSDGTGYARVRIRETNTSGTELQTKNALTNWASNQSFPLHVVAFWTASTTGDAVFVATNQRVTGTGNTVAQASATAPTLFWAENSYTT